MDEARSFTLSEEQQLIVDLVEKGHNVYFGGIAGCGKTFVARHVLNVLSRKGIEFACTCTTGIACTLYGHITARTIHSFSGIGHCRGTKEHLLRNVLSNHDCVERWRSSEVLFVDEISMLSKRTLETVHFIAQNVRNSEMAFGGIQVVAFGDFLQLPPVPNAIDDGKYAFESALWNSTFPHQIILEDSFRAKDDQELVTLLKEISKGQCSEQSLKLIKSMKRPLNPSDFQLSYVPQVFALNEDVDYANMCILDSLPGQEVIFEAYDRGEKRLLNKGLIASEKLALKIGAKVMFIYNINAEIKNGVMGKVVAFQNGLPLVATSSATIVVDRVTWPVYDRYDPTKVIGTRTQLPLKLAWAMTVHKAQGKTLDAVEIHCGKEFAPGHLYVAMSRVRSKDRMCIVGFNERKLIPAPKEVLTFFETVQNVPADPEKKCCSQKPPSLNERYQSVGQPAENESGDESGNGDSDEIDEVASGYFASTSQAEVVDLDDLLLIVSSAEGFHKVPDGFNYKEFIASLKAGDQTCGPEQSQNLTQNVNDIFTSLMQPDLLPKTSTFISVQWNRLFALIRKQVSENTERKVKRKDFTCHFADLHPVLVSEELEREFGELLGVPVALFEEHHYHALSELIFALNSHILRVVVGERFSSPTNQGSAISVKDMSDEAKGKVRYCGGWAISKVRNKCRDYFRSNMYSSDPEVKARAKEAYQKKELLDELVWSSVNAQQDSRYQDTLNVTLSWKYDKGNLTHVTDDMFEFTMELEQTRVDFLNQQRLATHQENLVERALSTILSNQQLQNKWRSLFTSSSDSFACNSSESSQVDTLILQLYSDVVTRYVKMAVGEFLRDFRRDFKLQKTEAHRKKVVEKKRKKDLVSSKVTLQKIKEDSSPNCVNSHHQLKAMIEKQETIFQTTVYNKQEVQLLCKAYGLSFKRTDSKAALSEKLTAKIRTSRDIPSPEILMNSTQQQPETSTSDTTAAQSSSEIPGQEQVEANEQADNLSVTTAATIVHNPTIQTQEPVAGCSAPSGTTAGANSGPKRKRFKPTKEEENILRSDQQTDQAMQRAYERSIEFNTTLKAVVNWHEKHK